MKRFLVFFILTPLAAAGIYHLPASPRWLLVEDASSATPRPLAGVRVTLNTPSGEWRSATDVDGRAALPREYAETPGILKLERPGYEPRAIKYPGGVSLRERLEPAPVAPTP